MSITLCRHAPRPQMTMLTMSTAHEYAVPFIFKLGSHHYIHWPNNRPANCSICGCRTKAVGLTTANYIWHLKPQYSHLIVQKVSINTYGLISNIKIIVVFEAKVGYMITVCFDFEKISSDVCLQTLGVLSLQWKQKWLGKLIIPFCNRLLPVDSNLEKDQILTLATNRLPICCWPRNITASLGYERDTN